MLQNQLLCKSLFLEFGQNGDPTSNGSKPKRVLTKTKLSCSDGGLYISYLLPDFQPNRRNFLYSLPLFFHNKKRLAVWWQNNFLPVGGRGIGFFFYQVSHFWFNLIDILIDLPPLPDRFLRKNFNLILGVLIDLQSKILYPDTFFKIKIILIKNPKKTWYFFWK